MRMVVCFAVWPCDKLAPCPRWNPVFTLWQLGQAPVRSMTLYASKAVIKMSERCKRLLLFGKHPLCNQTQSWIIPVTLWRQCTELEPVVCQSSHCVLYVSAGVLSGCHTSFASMSPMPIVFLPVSPTKSNALQVVTLMYCSIQSHASFSLKEWIQNPLFLIPWLATVHKQTSCQVIKNVYDGKSVVKSKAVVKNIERGRKPDQQQSMSSFSAWTSSHGVKCVRWRWMDALSRHQRQI